MSAFVGPGKLYLGGKDPASATLYCETTGNVLRDAAGVYTELTTCGAVSALANEDWELDVSTVQDLAAGKLVGFAFDNRGTVQDFVFIPTGVDPTAVGPDDPAFAGSVLVQALDIGGPSTGIATSSGTWKVIGDLDPKITTPFA